MHQQRRHYGQAAQSESGGGIFSGLGENARPATGNQQQVQQRRHYGSAASNLQDTSLVPHRAERPAWQVNLPRSTVHERTSHVGDDKLLTDDVGNARGGNAHYMTSYQRDMSACGTAGDLRDNVGASKPRRGRKPAPAIPVTAPHLHLSCGGVVGLSNLADSNAPLRAGTAAAVGHVSTANPEPFTALRVHSHDKAFHLLPENYQQQLLGYTGRNMELARTATTAAKAPSRPEWQG